MLYTVEGGSASHNPMCQSKKKKEENKIPPVVQYKKKSKQKSNNNIDYSQGAAFILEIAEVDA